MKKLTLICLLCFLGAAIAQQWTLDDILEMRAYGVKEREILAELAKRRIVVSLHKDIFIKLKAKGFSLDFIKKFRKLMEGKRLPESIVKLSKKAIKPVKITKFYKITTIVTPPQAGSIIIEPNPSKLSLLPAGTLVKIRPQAKSPYLFSHWQGDAIGYQPLVLKLSRDLTIVAHFAKSKPAAKPPMIEDPERFKDTRKAGHLYKGAVTGIIEGRGKSKDWGFACEVDYKYVYNLEYTSDVASNNGHRIREKRTFHSVKELLLVSKFRFHLDINEDLSWLRGFIKDVGHTLYSYGKLGHPTLSIIGKGIYLTVDLGEKIISGIEKKTFSQEYVKKSLEKITSRYHANRGFQNFRNKFVNPAVTKVLGYTPNMKLLEGKTFILEYEDGVGLVKIEIANKQQILTIREKELLQRAFYLSDYYIFKDRHNPQRLIRPGDTWEVDARTLAGVMDPRLRHKAKGIIKLARERNVIVKGQELACFALRDGLIKMMSTTSNRKITGEASLNDGKLFYDLQKRHILKAILSGSLNYRNVSQDHLFFKARLTTKPNIKVEYHCQCIKK